MTPRKPFTQATLRGVAEGVGCAKGDSVLVRCEYCGETGWVEWGGRGETGWVKLTGGMSLDHVVPVRNGGTDDLENLVFACISCNSSKGTKSLDEWSGYRVPRMTSDILVRPCSPLSVSPGQRMDRPRDTVPGTPPLGGLPECPARNVRGGRA